MDLAKQAAGSYSIQKPSRISRPGVSYEYELAAAPFNLWLNGRAPKAGIKAVNLVDVVHHDQGAPGVSKQLIEQRTWVKVQLRWLKVEHAPLCSVGLFCHFKTGAGLADAAFTCKQHALPAGQQGQQVFWVRVVVCFWWNKRQVFAQQVSAKTQMRLPTALRVRLSDAAAKCRVV